jgi:hypothetical protein
MTAAQDGWIRTTEYGTDATSLAEHKKAQLNRRHVAMRIEFSAGTDGDRQCRNVGWPQATA